MAEKKYIEREAAIERLEKLMQLQTSTARAIIEAIPAADVRPVVLCRDCVYANKDEHGLWCFNNFENCLSEDDFCSHGKRRVAETRGETDHV